MELFDIYHGFALYKVNGNTYVAKSKDETLQASSYHDIYATVYFHTV